MIRELESVVITHDFEGHALKERDVGTVVHCYSDGEAYEVEFATAEGRTVALLTLNQADIRSMTDTEILHARELSRV